MKDDKKDLINKAEDALNSEKYNIALKYYNRVLRVDPRNVEALTGQGISLHNLERGRPRIPIDKALEIDPDYVEALHYKGHILQDSEKYEEAIECFKKAYDKERNEGYLKDIGISFYLDDKLQDAITWLNQALELDPNYAEALYYKGFALQDSEKYEEAIECFKKSYEIDTSYSHSLTHMGICYYHLGDIEKALELFNKSLEKEPKDYETLCAKGLLVGVRNYKEGEKFFNEAKDVDKTDPDVWEAMGHLLYIKGKEKEAKRYFRRVLRSSSNRKEQSVKNQKVSLERLIENHENKNVELKSSLLFPYKFEGDVNTEEGKRASGIIEEKILQTIVGFMNTDGGELIVGVSDIKECYGLDKDYEMLKVNNLSEGEKFDKWKLHLENLIHKKIGSSVASLYVDIRRALFKDKNVGRIIIQKSRVPQYLYPNTDSCSFHIRDNGSTRKLNTQDSVYYIQNKFQIQNPRS